MTGGQDFSGEARGHRLGWTVRTAAWWLMAQGVVCLFMGPRSAYALDLRYSGSQQPYLRLSGLSLVCLGFFLLKALRDPKRQYLAVDVLILYLLGHVYFLLSFRLGYEILTPWEWLWGLVDLCLGTSLVLNRTRSGQMEEGAGTLLSEKAAGLALQAGEWMTKKGPPPRASLGNLGPPPEEAPGRAGKKSSEALPHLD